MYVFLKKIKFIFYLNLKKCIYLYPHLPLTFPAGSLYIFASPLKLLVSASLMYSSNMQILQCFPMFAAGILIIQGHYWTTYGPCADAHYFLSI